MVGKAPETPSATSGEVQIAYQAFGARPELARVAGLGGAGEVLVTRTVKELTSGSGIAYEERGAQTLRGVPGEWELYAAAPAGAR